MYLDVYNVFTVDVFSLMCLVRWSFRFQAEQIGSQARQNLAV